MEQQSPESFTCPEHDERCTKLGRNVLSKLLKGSSYVTLDPRFGGFVWNFPAGGDVHYDHISAGVNATGISVTRDDTLRQPGTDMVPHYGLRRTDA